jgi:hypothetical protein
MTSHRSLWRPKVLIAARDFFRNRLIDLSACNTAKELERDAAKMCIEVSQGAREVKAALRKTTRQRAVQIARGILAATAATLVALNTAMVQEIVPVLGASGGGWALCHQHPEGATRTDRSRGAPVLLLLAIGKASNSFLYNTNDELFCEAHEDAWVIDNATLNGSVLAWAARIALGSTLIRLGSIRLAVDPQSPGC